MKNCGFCGVTLLILTVINIQSVNYVCGQKFVGFDLAKSFIDVSTGIARKIPDTIPTPDAIFSASKNVIAGYPIGIALQTINLFCKYYIQKRKRIIPQIVNKTILGSAALSGKSIKPKVSPDLNKMNFVLMTDGMNYTIPLKNAKAVWNHSGFNRDLNTTILVTGWTSNINESNDALNLISDAYACRGDYNFVVRYNI